VTRGDLCLRMAEAEAAAFKASGLTLGVGFLEVVSVRRQSSMP
jgi:hypothetical protein